MRDYTKPLPTLREEHRPFSESSRNGRLTLQQSRSCGHLRYPISPYCPRCLSAEFAWTPVSGRGTVFSYIVIHQAYHPGFKADLPYNVALIQLEEGPRMYSNVVGVANDQVKVGDAV